MASNSFGTLFRFTTWGESHGPAIGVVIDGYPAGLPLDEERINQDLARRAPGRSAHTTPRKEADTCRILSGVFDGKSTGAPISLLIANGNADSSKYEAIAHLLRPGHANYTYLEKYGLFDYRGGGRASARETASRVAAGSVARVLLEQCGVKVSAWLSGVGEYRVCMDMQDTARMDSAAAHARSDELFAPGEQDREAMIAHLQAARADGDSIGGVVTFYAQGLPVGLGDPVYEKLEARLASAMLSIPACRGFEIGEGFAAAAMRGSACNDRFLPPESDTESLHGVTTASNHAGGTLGGISTGMPLYGRVAFKPTPSIFIPQDTVDVKGHPATFALPGGSRHDPCVAIRAVPVVEAMCCVVLADALLANRSARIEPCW